MTQSPEQIEAEIERTRESIKSDVDALQHKLDPRKVAGRQADRVKESVTQVKDTLMGASSERADVVSATVAGTAGAVTQTVSDVPARLRTRTGLTAFALGWLVSSLLPPSRREREAAQALRESPVLEPVVESARQVATEAGQQVKQAAAVVGEQAQQAASTVGEHAKESASQARQSVTSP